MLTHGTLADEGEGCASGMLKVMLWIHVFVGKCRAARQLPRKCALLPRLLLLKPHEQGTAKS